MQVGLVVAITVVAVALALLGLASTLARRRIGLLHLGVAAVLEVLLLVQAVLAVVRMARGETPPETATFSGYLAGIVQKGGERRIRLVRTARLAPQLGS